MLVSLYDSEHVDNFSCAYVVYYSYFDYLSLIISGIPRWIICIRYNVFKDTSSAPFGSLSLKEKEEYFSDTNLLQ